MPEMSETDFLLGLAGLLLVVMLSPGQPRNEVIPRDEEPANDWRPCPCQPTE